MRRYSDSDSDSISTKKSVSNSDSDNESDAVENDGEKKDAEEDDLYTNYFTVQPVEHHDPSPQLDNVTNPQGRIFDSGGELSIRENGAHLLLHTFTVYSKFK